MCIDDSCIDVKMNVRSISLIYASGGEELGGMRSGLRGCWDGLHATDDLTQVSAACRPSNARRKCRSLFFIRSSTMCTVSVDLSLVTKSYSLS